MAKKVKLLLTVTSVIEAVVSDDTTPDQALHLEQGYLDRGDIDVIDYLPGEGVVAVFSLVGVES